MPNEEKHAGSVEIQCDATPMNIMTEVVRAVLSQGASVAGIAALTSMFGDSELTPEFVLEQIHNRGLIMNVSVDMEIPQTEVDGAVMPSIHLGGAEETVSVKPGLFDTNGLH